MQHQLNIKREKAASERSLSLPCHLIKKFDIYRFSNNTKDSPPPWVKQDNQTYIIKRQ